MGNRTIRNPGRRSFLRTVPVAAAASLTLADAMLLSHYAAAEGAAFAPSSAHQVIRAQTIQDDIRALEANPGNKTLVDEPHFTMVLTVEKKATAKRFEWHEYRDHLFYIYDGWTIYEVGGTPQHGYSTGPGEWLAPASEGATKITLRKGDYLVIPRGTPHKRITPESVTLTLVAPMTPHGNIK